MDPNYRRFEQLRAAVETVLCRGTWTEIELTFKRLEIDWREDLGTGWGKQKYVGKVLVEINEEGVVGIAKRMIDRLEMDSDVMAVENSLFRLEDGPDDRISDVTRHKLVSVFEGRPLNSSDRDVGLFLSRFAEKNPFRSFTQHSDGTIVKKVLGDMVSCIALDEHVTMEEFLREFGFFDWPDRRLFEFLEAIVHPSARIRDNQSEWVNAINSILGVDGYVLAESDKKSGFPVYTVRQLQEGWMARPRTLVFASRVQQYKPVIGFSDLLDNDIELLEHEKTCIVYSEEIPDDGLTWESLVAWWAKSQGIQDLQDARKSLGARLKESLASDAEKHFFSAYFKFLRPRLGILLPALLPQVYIHYDPRNRRERENGRTYETQRMDFLLLLPKRFRVVIEVDGKQHYSSERMLAEGDINIEDRRGFEALPKIRVGLPNPELYSRTTSSGRGLQLRGYEVFRFGGHELIREGHSLIVEDFLSKMFRRFDLFGDELEIA